MLPIIPIHTSKQKNTTSATVRKRRPRALLTSTAVAASKKKKKKTKSPTESPQERSNVEEGVEQTTIIALKEPPSSTVQQQQHQPHGKNDANDNNTNLHNNNDEEDALVLAAEAAAALMDDLPQHTTTTDSNNNNHNSYVDNIPMGLLDETVDFAANIIMRGGNERRQVQEQQEGDIIQPVRHEQNEQVDDRGMKEGLLQQEEEEEGDQDTTTNAIAADVSKLSSVNKAKQGTSSISQVSEQQQRKNLNSIAQSTTRRNNLTSTEYELTNPLGKNVQTFTTKVPTSSSSSSKNNTTTDNSLQVMTMSAAQKNFISHYYYNNGVEGSMDNAILGGLSNKNSSKTKKKESGDDDDDDDEEVVDTNDVKRKSDNMAASEGSGGVSSEKENVTKEKEGGEEDDEASAMAMGGDSGGKKHISTLRSVCQSIPRSMKRKDPKNDKLKRGRRKKQKLNGDGAFGDDSDVHLLPKDEQVNVMQIADPTTAVGDSGMGVANNGKDATAPDQQNTDQQPQEEDETAVAVGPQVEVDEHGQIVIAQDSLLPNPETRQSTAQIDEEFGNNVVDEGETPARLGAIQARYDSYTTTPRQKPVRWSVDETKLFYRALRQCGTDFTMMQMFLVGRTRSQLKSKFKIEGRKNARLVDMALNPRSKVKLDLSVFGDLEIPEEVPALRVLQSPVSPVAAAATYGGNDQDNYQQGGSKLNNRGSMESTFDHLFGEEEVSPGAADHKGGKDTSQEMGKGKTEKGGQVQQPTKEQALAPVIAPPGPKAKVKKPFRPSKPKKTGSVATKKK